MADLTPEEIRLEEARRGAAEWKRWGPYLSERAWGTVREDYSAGGAAWEFFPHEHARSRVYRWNEDGLAGISDDNGKICFALALWNGRDPYLKERLFGLTGNQGNHGEDPKEVYFYLDSTPTHSYLKFLYKYPQIAFPYRQLIEENRRRGKTEPEFELADAGAFDRNRYFDVFVEYAKSAPEDIHVKITIINRGAEAAPVHLLPQIWFRNTWAWTANAARPRLESFDADADGLMAVRLTQETGERRFLYCQDSPQLLFTENETNGKLLFGIPNKTPFVKDAFHRFLVEGDEDAINLDQTGTKAAAHYTFMLAPGASRTVRLRLTPNQLVALEKDEFNENSERIFAARQREADEFYQTIIPGNLSADARSVMRQALAGMLWSKQFYHYAVKTWLDGDPPFPPPPEQRKEGRNKEWQHLYNADIVSMPDKWEYPWYAAWDSAFHCLPLSLVDADFAKHQLLLFLRESYQHPNGQLPAYEWNFGDVNPPVHAWATLRVYRIEAKRTGEPDREFLEKVFHKLLMNFTWWVNRKDDEGNNIFGGGFLGMDNVGVFDRNVKFPGGVHLEQSDGTSWMAMYSLNMLAIALELAKENRAYEDVASKFFEHFVYIADAMNNIGAENLELWDKTDGFYYDVLHSSHGAQQPIRVRSMVGLIPLFAVETVEADWLENLPEFRRRVEWFLAHRPDLTDVIECLQKPGQANRLLLALVNRNRLRRVLQTMLDETEFLSDYGVRSLSRYYREHPYILPLDGTEHCIDYQPAESTSSMFGGNSNWRGPIWFPVNYLLIESLQKFDYYFGADFKIECPTGSGELMTLWQVSQELSRRLSNIFLRDDNGRRAVYGGEKRFQTDEHWRDYILFNEYFNGDDGAGLGANHQTGWTGLVAKLLQQSGEYDADF